MRYLLLVVVVVCFAIIGFLIASYYKRRNKFFCDLLYFCDLLLNEINFMHSKLYDIIEKNKELFGVDFKNLLSIYEEYLQNKLDKTQLIEIVQNSLNLLNLDESKEIIKFILSLGSLDVENEINNINNYKIVFNKFNNSAEKDRQKYAPLIIKLSFIFGCMIAIIFL